MSKIEKVFNKILKPINTKIRNKCLNTNYEYKYSKKYNFENHVKSMLFLQLSGGDSLRDFDVKYNNHLKLVGEFEISSYSQLSRLNASKSVNHFKDMFDYILSIAQRERKSNFNVKKFKYLIAIDSSIINIGEALSPSLSFGDGKSAVRISTAYSYGTELPSNITISHAKIGERRCIENYINNKEFIHTFDKGYNSYSWFDELTSDGFKFISRLTANAVTEQYSSRYTEIENLYDLTVTLGTDYSKNKTKHMYREIESFNSETGEEFRLVSNIFDMSAQDLLSLYSKRWEIENFFKWIKQHLTIKHWLGRNLNAISIQIYCALIIYILLLIIKNRLKSSLTTFNLLRRLRSHLLETFTLEQVLFR